MDSSRTNRLLMTLPTPGTGPVSAQRAGSPQPDPVDALAFAAVTGAGGVAGGGMRNRVLSLSGVAAAPGARPGGGTGEPSSSATGDSLILHQTSLPRRRCCHCRHRREPVSGGPGRPWRDCVRPGAAPDLPEPVPCTTRQYTADNGRNP